MILFSGTGKENRDEGNDIARVDYPNGYRIWLHQHGSRRRMTFQFGEARNRPRRTKVWNSSPQHCDRRRLRRVWERNRNRPKLKHRLRLWQLNMNTNEISEYLNRDLICSKIFYGVYPPNKIPKLRSLPALIVCNTDNSSRPENIGS